MEKRPQSLTDLLPPRYRPLAERILNPRFRKRATPMSPQNLPYASMDRRLLATMLDTCIITLFLLPFNSSIMQALRAEAEMRYFITPYMDERSVQILQLSQQLFLIVSLSAIQAALLVVYSAIFWQFFSTTPGKWALRMHIVHEETGERMRWWQIIVRLVGYAVSTLPLCAGFFAISWSPTRQGWHDRLARTAVVARPMPPGWWRVGFLKKATSVSETPAAPPSPPPAQE